MDDKDQPYLTLYAGHTKKRRARHVCLTPEAVQYLTQYLNTFKPADSLLGAGIDSIRHYIKNLLDKAGLNQKDTNTGYYILHPHTLRKYCKTVMTQAGLPESFIDRHIGHKRYLDESYFKPNIEMIREQFQKAVPFLTIQKEIVKAGAETHDKISSLEAQIAELRNSIIHLSEIKPEFLHEAYQKTVAEELHEPLLEQEDNGVPLTREEIAKIPKFKVIPTKPTKIKGKKN